MAKKSKRRFERYATGGVKGSFSYSVEARVLNMSLGGFAVRTHTQLNIGRQYRFHLGSDSGGVQLSGVVRWCRMSGTEKQATGDVVPVYEAGIAFDDVLSGKAAELLGFLEKSVTIDLKQRVFGRFNLPGDDAVNLEGDSRFLVKQLSLSGMLIQAELSPRPEEELHLEVELGERTFASPARIVYVTEAEDESLRYRLGVEFLKPMQDQIEILEGFIRDELRPDDSFEGAGGE